MTLFRLAPATWKWLNAACAALLAILIMSDIGHAIRPLLVTGTQGSLGVQLDDEFSRYAAPPGSHLLHIQAFDSPSSLAAEGAQLGDALRFDHHLDRWRRFAPDEEIGLTLYRNGLARHLKVTARKTAVPFTDQFEYWGRVMLGLVSLLFCLMIGFKQGGQQTYRFLARTFLGTAALFFVNFHYSAAAAALQAGKLAALGLLPLLW